MTVLGQYAEGWLGGQVVKDLVKANHDRYDEWLALLDAVTEAIAQVAGSHDAEVVMCVLTEILAKLAVAEEFDHASVMNSLLGKLTQLQKRAAETQN